jgi:cytochrome P450
MVSAGNGQRAMIDPAFSHMRISHAFGAMKAAVDDHLLTLEEKAASGEAFSLDLAMSHLTADIICRTCVLDAAAERRGRRCVRGLHAV